MKISKILDFMGVLSVGLDNVSDSERFIFLKYLNQAHYELYNHTAALNDDLIINEEKLTTINIDNVDLSQRPLSFSKVYVDGYTRPLKELRLIKFVDYTKNTSSGSPCVFTWQVKKLSIYPLMKDISYNLDIWYTPVHVDLEEDTPEDEIPYPPSFHNVLLDGALYYLFQDEGGFKNSAQVDSQTVKWEKGKQDLYSYLFHKTGEVVSTHSNAI